MSEKWYVLSVFGKDQCGIVAQISNPLFDLNANVCETSMCRLGDYFTILAFLTYQDDESNLHAALQAICSQMQLNYHLDSLASHDHSHSQPDVILHFHGNDRSGLVAKVSSALQQANINILDLQSDVTGDAQSRQFLMTIEADASQSTASLEDIKQSLKRDGISVRFDHIDTLLA